MAEKPAGRRSTRDGGTAERILDSAERLVQARGFNGFSYADVASELGVTKASLHYHFPGKAELGEALVIRYARRFSAALADVDARLDDPAAKLAAYADLYGEVVRNRRMCLCGMLAAEYATLPDPMRNAVIGFFDESEAWLERVLEEGRRREVLRFDGPARDTARLVVSGLEGAMLVARPYGELGRFEEAATRLLEGLRAPAAARG